MLQSRSSVPASDSTDAVVCAKCRGTFFKFQELGIEGPGTRFQLVRIPGVGLCRIECAPQREVVPIPDDQEVVCALCGAKCDSTGWETGRS